MTTNTDQAPAKVTEAALVDANEAAAICGVSRSSWYKLVASGKTPKPIKLGNSVRWSRAELVRWIRAGCPIRSKWEAIKNLAKK